MHIVAIAGSLRQGSMNRQLAEAAGRIVHELDPAVQFTLLDWADVPLFNEDILPWPTQESARLAFTPCERGARPGSRRQASGN